MSLSRYLPDDFDPTQPVAVIAGQRLYPVLTVERLRAAGVPVCLVAFEGETRLDLYESFPADQRAMIKVGQVGHMLKALKRFGARSSMMVGQITPGRLFKGLHPDLKAVAILAKLKHRNAETIFGALADEMAKIDCALLDARAFLDDQMASPGLMTAGKFQPDEDSLQHGVHICREMARLDVGQGIVVNRGTVVAVEAFEGTDKMLERAGTFSAKEMVFVKTVKPNQDYRFDVPVFGDKTLETMAQHGIKAAALEADNVIMLDKPNVLAAAKQRGITLIGFSAT
ncbi:LpxI family protein [Cerasicoccus maritimus]|uniref:LpxI family protein n=1 Tax=Cerasicoccus maritimus TaxID=490089 RepID=UPI00285295C6|nr:UDP-2,3-diacylglucosamine diphosphatase LpxI [Cerasicoccus maritimus]